MQVNRPGCSSKPSMVKLAMRQLAPYRHGCISPLICTCGPEATVVVVDRWVVGGAGATVVVGGSVMGVVVSVGAEMSIAPTWSEGSLPEPASHRHVPIVINATITTATRPHQFTVHCDEVPSGDNGT